MYDLSRASDDRQSAAESGGNLWQEIARENSGFVKGLEAEARLLKGAAAHFVPAVKEAAQYAADHPGETAVKLAGMMALGFGLGCVSRASVWHTAARTAFAYALLADGVRPLVKSTAFVWDNRNDMSVQFQQRQLGRGLGYFAFDLGITLPAIGLGGHLARTAGRLGGAMETTGRPAGRPESRFAAPEPAEVVARPAGDRTGAVVAREGGTARPADVAEVRGQVLSETAKVEGPALKPAESVAEMRGETGPAEKLDDSLSRADMNLQQALLRMADWLKTTAPKPAGAAAEPVRPVVEEVKAVEPPAEPVRPVVEEVKAVEPPAEPVRPVVEEVKAVEPPAEPVRPVVEEVKAVEPVRPVVEEVKAAEPPAEPARPVVEEVKAAEPPVPAAAEPVRPVVEEVKPAEPPAEPVRPVVEEVKPAEPPAEPAGKPSKRTGRGRERQEVVDEDPYEGLDARTRRAIEQEEAEWRMNRGRKNNKGRGSRGGRRGQGVDFDE